MEKEQIPVNYHASEDPSRIKEFKITDVHPAEGDHKVGDCITMPVEPTARYHQLAPTDEIAALAEAVVVIQRTARTILQQLEPEPKVEVFFQLRFLETLECPVEVTSALFPSYAAAVDAALVPEDDTTYTILTKGAAWRLVRLLLAELSK